MWFKKGDKSDEGQGIPHERGTFEDDLIATRKPFPYKRLIFLVALIVVFGGLIVLQFMPRTGKQVAPVAAPEKDILTLFIPGDEGLLEKKSIEASKDLSEKDKAELIIKELKKEDGLPEGLVLREFTMDRDGIIYLNLSRHIKEEHMDPEEEIASVYGLVNSFISNFKDSKGVHILVEGETPYTIGGLLYTYMPLQFNNQLLEE